MIVVLCIYFAIAVLLFRFLAPTERERDRGLWAWSGGSEMYFMAAASLAWPVLFALIFATIAWEAREARLENRERRRAKPR